MAYRHGDRNQMQLLPPSIEEYVTPDDPVRAYNAFVDSLSLAELGILWDEHKVGNSEYNPKAMIKLLVYGYSYGLRSSRKLERATYHNLSFIWLMGGSYECIRITVIVPSQKQAHDRPVKPNDKEQFLYDEPNDRYICPRGHSLSYTFLDKHRNHKVYQITDAYARMSAYAHSYE